MFKHLATSFTSNNDWKTDHKMSCKCQTQYYINSHWNCSMSKENASNCFHGFSPILNFIFKELLKCTHSTVVYLPYEVMIGTEPKPIFIEITFEWTQKQNANCNSVIWVTSQKTRHVTHQTENNQLSRQFESYQGERTFFQ